MVLIISLIGRRAMPLSRKMQTRIDRINLIMREKLSGIRVIRAFGTEDYEEKRFDGANKDLMNNAMKMMHAMSLLGPSLILILNLTVVGLLWRAGQGIGTEPVMPGDILAIIQYVMQIMMSVTMLSMIFVMYPDVLLQRTVYVRCWILKIPSGIRRFPSCQTCRGDISPSAM